MTREATLKNLQTSLAMELTAAHQYQLHASVLDDWGMDRLANKMREEMAEELGHSDEYIARIMFLKGEPNLVFAKPPMIAKSLAEMFQSDLADEKEAIVFYSSAAAQAAEAATSVREPFLNASSWMKRGTWHGSSCSSISSTEWANPPISPNTFQRPERMFRPSCDGKRWTRLAAIRSRLRPSRTMRLRDQASTLVGLLHSGGQKKFPAHPNQS